MTIDLGVISRLVKRKIGDKVEVYHVWNFDDQLYEIKIVPAITYCPYTPMLPNHSIPSNDLMYIYKHQISMDVLTENYHLADIEKEVTALVNEIYDGFLLESL